MGIKLGIIFFKKITRSSQKREPRVPVIFFLCFDLDRQPRFELDHQLLIVDRNLLNKPPCQRLAVFGDRFGLPVQE